MQAAEKKQTIAEQIAALKFSVQHVRNPITQKSDDWKKTADQWLFVFENGETAHYYTGIGHRVAASFKRLKNANLSETGFRNFLSVSKPTAPSVKDLIYSFVMDSGAESESFSDWCSNYGDSTDSIKARDTYLACQESAATLRKLGFRDLDALREHFQDY